MEVDFVVVGTYSITDNRKKVIDFAGPYYVAGQSLLVRADDDSITGAESLQGGKKLCSVSGSTPPEDREVVPGVQLQQFDSYSSCVEALHRGKVDALTTDDIILAGYAAQYPGEFKLAGQPFTTELYGVGLPKGETEARMKINDAIEDMIATGAWQRALEETMGDSATRCPRRRRSTGTDAEEVTWLIDTYGDQLVSAFWTTVQLTFWSALGALIWGTILAAMRVSPVPILRIFATWYVNIFRNTPLTLIIVFCSVGLYQNLGVHFAPEDSSTFIDQNNFRLAVLGFVVYTAAFVCESLRSGINTVPIGQAEAARSLGLTFTQGIRMIVLPQAFRAVIAPLGSVLIALTKNTPIASAIGVAEASLLMKTMIENEADKLFLVFGIFAIGFMILTLPVGFLFGYLGKRLAVKR